MRKLLLLLPFLLGGLTIQAQNSLDLHSEGMTLYRIPDEPVTTFQFAIHKGPEKALLGWGQITVDEQGKMNCQLDPEKGMTTEAFFQKGWELVAKYELLREGITVTEVDKP